MGDGMDKKSARPKSRGLTLIEVLIVCLLMSGVIIGFIGVYNASFALNEQLRSSVKALNDASSVLESMRNIDPFDISAVIALYPDNGLVAGYNNLGQETVRVNYTNVAADPIAVTVTVTWQAGGARNYSERIVTLLTQR